VANSNNGQNSRDNKTEDLWASDVPVDRLVVEAADRASIDPQMIVNLEGFSGPLDLLLALARSQKVDLAKISILKLAEQYLVFIEELRKFRLELAADYLVMAAWLAYLKSRLLLPPPHDDDEPSGEELAAVLAFRLQRLEAMREAAEKLMARNRLGQDIFARGVPEPIVTEKTSKYQASYFDLLSAYVHQRQRTTVEHVTIKRREVWSLQDARDTLTRMLGKLEDWTPLDSFILDYLATPEERVSAIASSFAASLELVREGSIEIRQDRPFAPIYMRQCADIKPRDKRANLTGAASESSNGNGSANGEQTI
jgi:segregation and condensation protein A